MGNVVSKDMILKMNENPIIFAMANPDPEISPKDAFEARQDIIMATGRTDYPNQVNNVLGSFHLQRSSRCCCYGHINEMKVAASIALAKLAKLGAGPEIAKNIIEMSLYMEKNILFHHHSIQGYWYGSHMLLQKL